MQSDEAFPNQKKVQEIMSKCGSLSDSIILERRGGDMWDDLKKWVDKEKNHRATEGQMALNNVVDKIKEIEREYGVAS